MNQKVKCVLLSIGSFLASVAPILTIVLLKWDVYTKQSYGGTVKLCLGGLLALLFLFLKVIGKLRMPRRIVLFGVVFGMSWLLQTMLEDLFLLSGMALFGELVDYIFFQTALKRAREALRIGKTADATAGKVEELLKKYTEGDRA